MVHAVPAGADKILVVATHGEALETELAQQIRDGLAERGELALGVDLQDNLAPSAGRLPREALTTRPAITPSASGPAIAAA